MITRRGILGILAAGFAPAAIGSGVLMPVRALQPIRFVDNFNRADSRAPEITRAWVDENNIMRIEWDVRINHVRQDPSMYIASASGGLIGLTLKHPPPRDATLSFHRLR